MSGDDSNDKLDIGPAVLADAAGKAAAAQSASVVFGKIAPPPRSQMDEALALLAGTIEVQRHLADTTDDAWAVAQTTTLDHLGPSDGHR